MAFTRTWSVITPADTDLAKNGARDMRYIRVDLEERLELEHSFAADADDGRHLEGSARAYVQATAPTPPVGFTEGRLWWDSDDGVLKVHNGTDFQNVVVSGISGVTASAAELNLIDGSVAGTAVASKALVLGADKNVDTIAIAEGGLKIGAGAGTAVTSSAAELNVLDGIPGTLTATELGYVDGVTSAIQTQLNARSRITEIPADIAWAASYSSGDNESWVDYASVDTFWFPLGASTLSCHGTLNTSGAGDYTGYVRLRIGSTYSNEISHTGGGSTAGTLTIDVTGVDGTRDTLYIQHKVSVGDPSGGVQHTVVWTPTTKSDRFVSA